MASENQCSPYEQLRNENVERNRNVMRMLGLLPQSRLKRKFSGPSLRRQSGGRHRLPVESESDLEVHAAVKRSSWRNSHEFRKQPRRSKRIAAAAKSSTTEDRGRGSCNPKISRQRCSSESKCITSKHSVPISVQSTEEKVQEIELKMDKVDMQDGYSSDVSLDSMYAVEFTIGGESSGTVPDVVLDKQVERSAGGTPSTTVSSEAIQSQFAAAFGNQLQEMVLRALLQPAGAFTGLQSAIQTNAEVLSTGKESISMGTGDVPKTWSERTYNIVKARHRKETQMTRTSAGEGSDSQKDLPIPENESPQQRAVRTRRLNRLRAKRAKDLTNNRKAFKKRPYVLHVDGMAKAKGIHKQVWRAALRGQCGRLDPTMDNINHHPKHVVDSIWQALEKEWEFEGFTHRAREMFERSATKFMRNRKMQLKYKCKRIVDDSKPDDVNGMHWKKIKLSTQRVGEGVKPLELEGMSSRPQQKLHGPEEVHVESDEDEQERMECRNSISLDSTSLHERNTLADTVDVDARIRSLQSELLRLQNSRELGFQALGSRVSLGTGSVSGHETTKDGNRDSKMMKENVHPQNADYQSVERGPAGKKVTNDMVLQELVFAEEKGKEQADGEEGNEKIVKTKESLVTVEDVEMDCGDVVRVYAYTAGIKEEIGRGIVMGLAGSKFAKKVIPKAWRSIKITSCTNSGASKICPFPPGWTEQLKSKTVKEVNGRIILWPDMLLRSVGDE